MPKSLKLSDKDAELIIKFMDGHPFVATKHYGGADYSCIVCKICTASMYLDDNLGAHLSEEQILSHGLPISAKDNYASIYSDDIDLAQYLKHYEGCQLKEVNELKQRLQNFCRG